MSYAMDYPIAAHAPADARASFIRRTYGHLAGAILAFVAIEAAFLKVPGIKETIFGAMQAGGFIVILIAFIAAGYLAQWWAHSATSPALQYLGLALYVVVEAVIFLPILFIATRFYPDAIPTAGILTLGIFGGLTAAVFVTRKDYSHLGPILSIGCFLALGFAVAGALFGFNMPLVYCFFVVALACGFILYDTSNVIHHYRTDQHVGAALQLFASVALLFYYILRIVMAYSRNN